MCFLVSKENSLIDKSILYSKLKECLDQIDKAEPVLKDDQLYKKRGYPKFR